MHTTDHAAARGHLASDEQGRLVQNGAGRARSVRSSARTSRMRSRERRLE
jgi:hypothetical protein